MLGLSKTTERKPECVLIYGVEGVGKSSLAASAPSPVFIGTEDGIDELDVYHFPPPKTWDEVLRDISRLQNEKHEAKTLVVDSLDWLEPLVHKEVLKNSPGKTMATVGGGYGAGYNLALSLWLEFIEKLEALRNSRKMNICLLAHADSQKFQDPQLQAEYMRYQLKLHKLASAKFKEYVSAVFFMTFETFADEEKTMTKAKGKGVRVVMSEHRPGWDAKNRYGLPPKITLPSDPSKGWEHIFSQRKTRGPSKDQVMEQIMEYRQFLAPDAQVKLDGAVENARGDVAKLQAIAEHARKLSAGE